MKQDDRWFDLCIKWVETQDEYGFSSEEARRALDTLRKFELENPDIYKASLERLRAYKKDH